MSLHKKIKVVDFATLQLEKQRLKAVCEVKKIKLEQHLAHLKKNYPEVVMKAVLPFSDETNDRIFKGAKWVNDTVSDYVGNSDSKLGKFVSGKGSNMLQAALIYFVVRIARNIFFKRK